MTNYNDTPAPPPAARADRPERLQTLNVIGHGHFSFKPSWIDRAIDILLPTSIDDLRRLLTDQTGIDYTGSHETRVNTLFELLVIWADINRPTPEDYNL